jgi:hypothetical protein
MHVLAPHTFDPMTWQLLGTDQVLWEVVLPDSWAEGSTTYTHI